MSWLGMFFIVLAVTVNITVLVVSLSWLEENLPFWAFVAVIIVVGSAIVATVLWGIFGGIRA